MSAPFLCGQCGYIFRDQPFMGRTLHSLCDNRWTNRLVYEYRWTDDFGWIRCGPEHVTWRPLQPVPDVVHLGSDKLEGLIIGGPVPCGEGAWTDQCDAVTCEKCLASVRWLQAHYGPGLGL